MAVSTRFEFPLLQDEVTAIVQDAVLSTLEGQVYDHAKVNQWNNNMTSACTEDLKNLSPNFKYVITCFICERKGSGIHMQSSSFWDQKADGSCTISWENPTISVVLCVYGFAL